MRLIDADALIEDMDGDLTDSIAEGKAIEKIMNAPTIEERKKGKWITDKYGSVRCSECNWCAPQIMTGCLVNRHLDYEKSAFCWYCGADMRGEQNG